MYVYDCHIRSKYMYVAAYINTCMSAYIKYMYDSAYINTCMSAYINNVHTPIRNTCMSAYINT